MAISNSYVCLPDPMIFGTWAPPKACRSPALSVRFPRAGGRITAAWRWRREGVKTWSLAVNPEIAEGNVWQYLAPSLSLSYFIVLAPGGVISFLIWIQRHGRSLGY